MRLPAPLSRTNPNVHKNSFGHVLIIAGSARMLGAGVLTSLAAMRTGAGLVTLGIPRSLNTTAQKKISPVIMTWPLPETREGTLSLSAATQILHHESGYSVIALGPGLGRAPATLRCVQAIIKQSTKPLVLDADALFAIARQPDILLKTKSSIKILTPHPGEMARLINTPKKRVEQNRKQTALAFARRYNSILILKGHRTLVACKNNPVYTNTTGNAGMATAGSGDVLTGMIAALLAQNIQPFTAAKAAVYLHGKAGDIAAKKKTKAGLVATDIIDHIPAALRAAR